MANQFNQPYDINWLRQMSLFGQPPENIGGGQAPMGPFSPPNFPSPPPITPQPQQQMPPPMPVTPFQGSGGDDDVMAMFNKYQPDTTSRDRFNNLLDNMPQREQPGWARRLVASGMGIGSKDPIGTMENVMYAPYMRDITEWKEKTQPYAQAAQLENTANVNERQLMGNMASVQGAQNKLASQERIQTERNNINRIKAYAAQLKAQRYEIKILGSQVVGFGPNGERQDLGTSNGMDELDKLELQNAGRVAAAEASGAAALNRQQVGGGGMFQGPNNERYQVDPNDTTKLIPVQGGPTGPLNRIGTPPSGGAGNQPNVAERKFDEQEKLKNLYLRYKEARDVITKNDDGTYELPPRPIVDPGSFFRSAVTQQQVDDWDAVMKYIDPTYVPPPAKGGGGGAPVSQSTPSGLVPAGEAPPQKEVFTAGYAPGQGPSTGTGRYQLPQPTPEPRGLAPSYLPGQGPQRGEQPRIALPPPDTRIPIFNKNGQRVGYIENTPEQIESAAAQGFSIRK